MTIPKINTRATNVELTDERKSLIIQKLVPLGRYLPYEDDIQIDVVMRRVRVELGSDMYCVSVKLTTASDIYMGVATEHHLQRALSRVRDTLRRAISRGASVANYRLRQSERNLNPDYTLTL